MAETDLNIILKLLDQASAGIKESMAGIKTETKKVNDETEKAGKTIQQQFKDAGKELKSFRQAMLGVTIAIAVIIGVTKEWSKYNEETKNAFTSLGNSISKISGAVGSIFAPAIVSISKLLEELVPVINSVIKWLQEMYTWLFNKITYATQYWVAFFSAIKTGIGIIKANKIAVQQATRAVEEMGKEFKSAFENNIPYVEEIKQWLEKQNNELERQRLLFLGGKITSKEYYDFISSVSVQRLNDLQEEIKLIERMAELQRLNTDLEYQRDVIARDRIKIIEEFYIRKAQLNNQDLMNQQQNMVAANALLQTVKESTVTMWSTLYGFVNTLYTGAQQNISKALSSIIMGTKSTRQAFTEMGIAMLQMLSDFAAKMIVNFILSMTLGKLISMAIGIQAGAIAAAWMPAAILASIATLGAADAAGLAGLTAAMAGGMAILGAANAVTKAGGTADVIDLGKIDIKKHFGGIIRAHNGLAADEVPIIAQTGEGILSRKGMAALGGDLELNRLNAGQGGNSNTSIYIENALFKNDSDTEETLLTISRLIEQKRRARI